MTDPVCRICYAGTLTTEERERFQAEPVTMPVFYCDEHAKIINNMLGSFDWDHIVILGSKTGRITRNEPQPQFPRNNWEQASDG